MIINAIRIYRAVPAFTTESRLVNEKFPLRPLVTPNIPYMKFEMPI